MGAPADDPRGGRRGVAVFGSSEPHPGDPAYQAAQAAGGRLAAAGLVVNNGGHRGVMEAASRGAREAGGDAVGITVASFAGRGRGKRWLSREICAPDLVTRTRSLVDLAAGFLVLPGKAGTLAEVSFLWALRRAGLLGTRPVVLAGVSPWSRVLRTLESEDILDPATLAGTWLASDTEAATGLLLEKMG
jgi:uncharacterized protein (TIGR00730 family)